MSKSSDKGDLIYMSVTNAKILKRNILLLKVSGYMVYIIEIFWKILKKKF